jgi:hypothetical protein
MWVESYSAAWYLEGIISSTVITTSLPLSLWHDASQLAFSGPEPCEPSGAVTPSTVWIPGLNFGGGTIVVNIVATTDKYERYT